MNFLTFIFSGRSLFLFLVFTLSSNIYFAQDDPCGAIPLTVNSSCSFTTYNYASSLTNSAGIPAPGCAGYSGDDMWFSAVVPSSGRLIVDTDRTCSNSTCPADMGMAFYSASSCSDPFTLIECDDDDGIGSMPKIDLQGLTPGSTVYIRVWEYGADRYGDFEICATTIIPPPPPSNDDPCGATALTVNTSCSYSTSTLSAGATGSTGIPAPGCASYSGGDLWFSAVVPSTGTLIVDLNTVTGGPSDMGMAFYSASSCSGPFTFIECDDDDSPNGSMPKIDRQGLTPGTTVYIRVWEFGNDVVGDFNICATTTTPPTPCVGDAGNNTCSSADPFCTGTAYNYCNSTGVPTMGTYACLSTTPNPMWMYLNVQSTGGIDIFIEQFKTDGTPIDVDFALYGPYTGISSACTSISTATTPIDCSYSGSATETANIPSATAGQWYIILITNYNGSAGYIEFSQISGSGTTNCNIVNPSCLITGVTATPSNCNASNQYSVSGAVSVSNPPTTGTLTVSSSCGGSQTFDAPFTSPINYSLTGLTPSGGTCTVTASFSATSCSLQQTFTSPSIPTVSAGSDKSVCAGSAVSITATGASTYTWTPSTGLNSAIIATVSASPTISTTYTVTGVNTQGCSSVSTVLITVDPLPNTDAGSDASVCAGESTTLTASGATTYSWSPATGLSSTTGATVTATPSANATYTVTGTTGGCTKSDEVLITVKPLPNVVASADQDICNGSSVTLNANGAASYTWLPATSLNTSTGATVISSATSNITYIVTGTTSGCTKSAEVDVNVYPVATVDANSDRSVCAGGTIILAGSVGGAATSGFWTASSGTFSNANSLTSSYTPSISSGTVTLTLSTNDPSGPCSAVTDQIVVTVNPSPATIAGDASFCAGGSTTLTASGADNYSWSPSTGLSATTGASVTANPSSNASYTVTGTSASGCTSTDLVVVTVNPIPSINPGSNQTLCQGPNVTLAATGASTYSWTGGVTNGVPFTPSLGTQTYTVTGTSSNNCSATASLTITVNALPVVVSNDVSVCQSNTINVLVSGANSYTWSPTTYLSSASGSSVIYTPGLTTTYTVTGTTLLGCTSTDQVTVTVLSNAPINAGQDVSICLGASTTLTANGGSNYNWNNGLGSGNSFPVSPTISTTYSVVGTDAAGCQGTDNVTVSIISPPSVSAGSNQTVCAGTPITLNGGGATSYSWNPVVTNGVAFVPTANQTYIVTGTTSGCTATASVQVTVNPLPVTDAGPDKSVCTGASVTLSGSGTGAASYSWSGGISNGVAFIPPMTGTYTLTGTSLSGCTSSDQVLVTLNSLPIVNAGPDQPVCDGATVTLSGLGASNYSWSGGVTNGLSFIPSLGAMAYTVTGTSSAGCTGTDQVVVTVNPKPTPVIQGLSTYCTGSSAGLSTTSPYSSYLWSTGSVTPTINATIANNPISVTVTNSFGCSGVSSVYSVSENSVITANFTSTICQGESVLIHGISRNTAGVYSQTFSFGTGCDSIANVTLVVNPLPAVFAGADQTWCIGSTTSLNATGAVTYSWTNGITNGVTFTPTIGSTVYTVTGTSSQGCVATDQVVVFVNSLPIINAGADVSVCLGSPVILNGLGGSNYTWNNGVTNGLSFIPPLTSTYTVTGTDANGCTGTDQVLVNINSLPIVGAGQDAQICQGASVILSGSGAINYTWSNGVFNNVSFVASGSQTYTVTGTDANGCTNTDQVLVNVNSLPIINAGPDQTVCLGTNVTLTGAGAVTYLWDNGVQNGIAFLPSAGMVIYTVTGTSNFGCTNTDQVSVIVNPLPTVFAGLDDAICLGESVTLNGSGAPTYTWNNGVVNGVAFSPTSTLTYTLTGTSTSGCTNSDQVVVSVNPLPNVFAGNDLSVCDGVAITLTGSGAATYSWDNGVINGTSFNSSVGTIIYTVTGTSSTGCVNSDQVNVTVNTAPLVSFNADETIGCVPLLVNFTNTTPSSSNCIWTFSDGTVLVGCGSVSNSFDQVGCFDATLTVTDNNGCSNSFSAVDYICTQASPIAAFTPSQTEVSSFSTEVTFLNTSYGASNYYWSFAESSYSIEQNPVYVFPEDAGSYVVTLVASSSLGCTDVATATINVKEELVFFVPNTFTPDNDDYNDMFKPVFYSGFDPYDFSLLIFNRWGETVFESYNAESGWDGSYGANNEIKVVQEGTYTWVIRYRETENKGVRKVTGHVNVIR